MEEAKEARERARRRHHDATHHVFACRISEEEVRFDDDGEPPGTGGRPVLAALEAADLVRALVVVTRWFGGTRLGTGGLSRAYRRAAEEAVRSLELRSCRRGRRAVVRFPYGDTGVVMGVVEAVRAARLAEAFGDEARLEIAVSEAALPELRRRVRSGTSGRASVEVEDDELLVPVADD